MSLSTFTKSLTTLANDYGNPYGWHPGNPGKTVEKMAKNGLENNGVYIIWKIRGNTAPGG